MFSDSISDYDLDFTDFGFEADNNIVDNIDTSIIDFSETNDVFISEDGTQIPIKDLSAPRAICTHSMINGYLNITVAMDQVDVPYMYNK